MVRAALLAACASGELVRLVRPFASRRISGYIIAVGERAVLIHQLHDFLDDGWSVIRIADVDEVVAEGGSFFAAALRAEGLTPRAPVDALDLTSMTTAVRALHELGRAVIVESEVPGDGDADGYQLGALRAVTDLHAHVQLLDTGGQWTAIEPVALPRITRVRLETPYLVTFSKYAAPWPAPGEAS
jgi:hypothetical protein